MNDKTHEKSRLRVNTFEPDRYCACDSRFFKRDEDGVLWCWLCGKLVWSSEQPVKTEPMKVRETRAREFKVGFIPNALKTHCPKGHPYDEANTFVNKSGGRECRNCRREQKKRKRAEMVK